MAAKTPLTPHVLGTVGTAEDEAEELPEDVALAAAEVALAADPRAKLAEPGFMLADDAAAEALTGGADADDDDAPPTGPAPADDVATADVGTMRLAVELTPGMPVPDGISTMFEVAVAFSAACAMAIWLFSRSYTT